MALTAVVPAQAPPSADLSELSADDGLEGITDHPSTPGTFEAAKDLIELLAASPLPYGENSPAPMFQVPSRGKPAMVCRSRTPSRHRSWSWSQSSSDSTDSLSPAAQKEVAAPAAGQREEAPERVRRSPAPPRDRHREELRWSSPEDSRRQSRSRERWPRSRSRSRFQSRGYRYRYRSRSARSRSFSCRCRSLASPWPSQLASPQSDADSGRYSCPHQDPDNGDPQGNWQPQWGLPGHWPFWTPWAYQEHQGGPSRASYSVQTVLEATVSRPPASPQHKPERPAPSLVPSHGFPSRPEPEAPPRGKGEQEDQPEGVEQQLTSSSSPKEETHQELADKKSLYVVEFREECGPLPIVVASPNGDVRKEPEPIDEVPNTKLEWSEVRVAQGMKRSAWANVKRTVW
ncbi:28S ribosomal protein S5 [Chelonia mydas]|uniref:28S ribosomal protein S5 n=1 Tax=Chelonia mydas TaxID=8469 RepID=M7BLH5_CHEMY|nr:28S ribosomal protein S5 [Chelonia mydas]